LTSPPDQSEPHRAGDDPLRPFPHLPRRHRHAFIDRALYLPKVWADDPARRAAAHVPQQIAFATKPHLARAMIERTIAAGVPFAGVVGDSI